MNHLALLYHDNFLILIILLFIYYQFIKKWMMYLALRIASRINIVSSISFSQLKGSIELILIAVSHLLFSGFMIYINNIPFEKLFKSFSFLENLFGILIGMGSLGVSYVFCSLAIQIVKFFYSMPVSSDDWLVITRSGWIRHHFDLLKTFPFIAALIIFIIQISSEEIIFRGVLINKLLIYGSIQAILISTILFILVQALHMPNMLCAMFPMIGASILGFVHAYLFLNHFSIIPLICSHLAFFMFVLI